MSKDHKREYKEMGRVEILAGFLRNRQKYPNYAHFHIGELFQDSCAFDCGRAAKAAKFVRWILCVSANRTENIFHFIGNGYYVLCVFISKCFVIRFHQFCIIRWTIKRIVIAIQCFMHLPMKSLSRATQLHVAHQQYNTNTTWTSLTSVANKMFKKKLRFFFAFACVACNEAFEYVCCLYVFFFISSEPPLSLSYLSCRIYSALAMLPLYVKETIKICVRLKGMNKKTKRIQDNWRSTTNCMKCNG